MEGVRGGRQVNSRLGWLANDSGLVSNRSNGRKDNSRLGRELLGVAASQNEGEGLGFVSGVLARATVLNSRVPVESQWELRTTFPFIKRFGSHTRFN